MGIFYKQTALFFKSLADENRLRIILNLAHEKKSVSKIVEDTNLSQPLVSHHLRELRNNHVLTTQREGSFVFYKLSEPAIVMLVNVTNQLVIELNERGNILSTPEDRPEFPFSVMMQKMFELMNQKQGDKK